MLQPQGFTVFLRWSNHLEVEVSVPCGQAYCLASACLSRHGGLATCIVWCHLRRLGDSPQPAHMLHCQVASCSECVLPCLRHLCTALVLHSACLRRLLRNQEGEVPDRERQGLPCEADLRRQGSTGGHLPPRQGDCMLPSGPPCATAPYCARWGQCSAWLLVLDQP